MSQLLQLHRLVSRSFDNDELKTLCFDLGVDIENLPAVTKQGRARELILLLDRHGRISELVRALEGLGLRATCQGANPYVGLLPFDERDAPHFFGRGALVATLLDRAASDPSITLLGPSGSGKSSVMRAGLIPALRAGRLPGSERWCYARPLRPGHAPLRALAAELLRLKGDQREGRVTALREQLANDPATFLDELSALLAQQGASRLVLLVDQFEELWTHADVDGREPFITLLVGALRELERAGASSPLLLLTTLRADFYGRAEKAQARAGRLERHLVRLRPLQPAALRRAIVQPSNGTNVSFEEGLVEFLVEQVSGRRGALPLLAATLRVLWEQQGAGGQIGWASYRALGGIEGALTERADTVLARRYSEAQCESLVRPLLLELVELGDGLADSARRRRLDEMAPADCTVAHLQELLHPLVEARLLTASADEEGRPCVELSHEALIRGWPRLRRWLDEARDDVRTLRRLEAAALDWERHGRCGDYLWRGDPLASALTWEAESELPLPASASAFLRASVYHIEARQRATEEAARREALLARRARRLAWSLALAVGLGARGRSRRVLKVGGRRPRLCRLSSAPRGPGATRRAGRRPPPVRRTAPPHAALVYRYLASGRVAPPRRPPYAVAGTQSTARTAGTMLRPVIGGAAIGQRRPTSGRTV